MYPTWKNGKQIGKHRRDFAGRYEAVRDWLKANNFSGFTALDFGAGGGYFTARLAEDFKAEVTAVEKDPRARQPLSRAKAIRVINEHLSADDLAKLDYVDVALALNVLHHLPEWRSYLDVLASKASVVFIEVANPAESLPNAVAHGDSADIEAEVKDLGAQPLHQSPGYHPKYQRTLYVLDKRYGGDDDEVAEADSEPLYGGSQHVAEAAALDNFVDDGPDPQPQGEPSGEVTQVEAEPSQPKPKRKPRKRPASDGDAVVPGGDGE